MDLLDTFLVHNLGTNTRLIEQSSTLTDAQLDQEFDLGHRTVRATLDHIIENIEWWTDLMSLRPKRTFESLGEDPLSLVGLMKRLEIASAEFATLARQAQTEGRLDDKWPPREDQLATYCNGTTIVHVITHAAHHRSQVIHMLRQLGVDEVVGGEALHY